MRAAIEQRKAIEAKRAESEAIAEKNRESKMRRKREKEALRMANWKVAEMKIVFGQPPQNKPRLLVCKAAETVDIPRMDDRDEEEEATAHTTETEKRTAQETAESGSSGLDGMSTLKADVALARLQAQCESGSRTRRQQTSKWQSGSASERRRWSDGRSASGSVRTQSESQSDRESESEEECESEDEVPIAERLQRFREAVASAKKTRQRVARTFRVTRRAFGDF
jgi:hypothetical protein